MPTGGVCRVVFQVNTLALGHAAGESGGFFAEPFYRPSGVYAFGCVNADQPYPFAGFEHDRIAVDHSFDTDKIVGVREGGEDREKDGNGECGPGSPP